MPCARQTVWRCKNCGCRLAARVLAVINGYLGDRGLSLRQGTIVDAMLINAPSSTKNKVGKRDPDMHQTKKSNKHYFSMKTHDESGFVHSVVGTATNATVGSVFNQVQHLEQLWPTTIRRMRYCASLGSIKPRQSPCQHKQVTKGLAPMRQTEPHAVMTCTRISAS